MRLSISRLSNHLLAWVQNRVVNCLSILSCAASKASRAAVRSYSSPSFKKGGRQARKMTPQVVNIQATDYERQPAMEEVTRAPIFVNCRSILEKSSRCQIVF